MRPVLIFSLLSLTLSNQAFSQGTVNQEIVSSEHAKPLSNLSFKSNRFITPDKAPLLEERFKVTFPDVKSISIDAETQKVMVVLPLIYKEETVQNILRYFNTTTYEIN